MAALMSGFRLSVLRKSHLEFPRLLAFASLDRNCQAWNSFSSDKRNFRSSDKSARRFLTFSALFSSIGYILYKWKDDFRERFNSLSVIVPTVSAKAFFTADPNQNRERYNFIADVVEVSAPAVVYIEIRDPRRTDFFTGKPLTMSNGSGFIVSNDGLILTNAHVVVHKPNTAVQVRLHDGSTYSGIVEDVDMQRDLATVRINKNNLPVMKLGSSASLRPGEFVVAIGSPLNLSNTITSGIVSSVNRQSEELGLHNVRMDYIQTDAAITFGNSGGPLVNLDGEAIGINVMKVTAGISFAIPIDYAKEFLKKVEERRRNKEPHLIETTEKRFLGITMLSLTADIIYEIQRKGSFLKSPITHGVLVWQIMIHSPAYRAGLHTGDIITHVNKEIVTSAANIYKRLESPGVLHFTIVRDGSVLEISVEPEDI